MAKYEGFLGAARKAKSLAVSAMRCINWYLQPSENKYASTYEAAYPTPGYKLAVTIEDDTLPAGSFTRAVYRTSKGLGFDADVNGSVIIVVGPNVYWLKENLTYDKLGSISNAVSKISMVDDGFGLIIADGTSLWRLDLQTKAFTSVFFDLIGPTSVDYIEGYTVVSGQLDGIPQNTFFFSGQYDNASWDALDYYSAEQSQDPITGLIVSDNRLHLLGPTSYEQFETTGDSDSPFRRISSNSGDVGLHAPESLIRFGNSVFMIGATDLGTPRAYMLEKGVFRRISDIDLESEWAKSNITDCTTFAESLDGKDNVIFNFDNLNKTYAFDVHAGIFHQRASRDEITDKLFRWEPNYLVNTGSNTVVGDRFSTNLYFLSNDYTTENGRNIRRVITTSHTSAEQDMILIQNIRFDMETGNGITDEDPADRFTQAPVVMYKYSFDRARTWSSTERYPFGITGDYEATVETGPIGATRNFTQEFSITDPCKTAILNGFMTVQVGSRGRR